MGFVPLYRLKVGLHRNIQVGTARYPIPEGAQGQLGWGSGQPDVVGGNPTHGSRLELDGLLRSLPT